MKEISPPAARNVRLGQEGSPPLAPPLCVCGDVFTLPHLTKDKHGEADEAHLGPNRGEGGDGISGVGVHM